MCTHVLQSKQNLSVLLCPHWSLRQSFANSYKCTYLLLWWLTLSWISDQEVRMKRWIVQWEELHAWICLFFSLEELYILSLAIYRHVSWNFWELNNSFCADFYRVSNSEDWNPMYSLLNWSHTAYDKGDFLPHICIPGKGEGTLYLASALLLTVASLNMEVQNHLGINRFESFFPVLQ